MFQAECSTGSCYSTWLRLSMTSNWIRRESIFKLICSSFFPSILIIPSVLFYIFAVSLLKKTVSFKIVMFREISAAFVIFSFIRNCCIILCQHLIGQWSCALRVPSATQNGVSARPGALKCLQSVCWSRPIKLDWRMKQSEGNSLDKAGMFPFRVFFQNEKCKHASRFHPQKFTKLKMHLLLTSIFVTSKVYILLLKSRNSEIFSNDQNIFFL